MNWEVCSAVECNPHKISGAWAFTGTRVPVYTLSEYMESRATMKQFLARISHQRNNNRSV